MDYDLTDPNGVRLTPGAVIGPDGQELTPGAHEFNGTQYWVSDGTEENRIAQIRHQLSPPLAELALKRYGLI